MIDLSPGFIDDLKSKIDIAQVVAHYVHLKRRGNRLVGLCPFHKEKTPSFGVHLKEPFFKCFGCDSSGDVITFTEKIEGIGFVEAVKLLADRYGIPIQDRPQQRRPQEPSYSRETLAEAALFRVGFRWFLERYLEPLKELCWLDETSVGNDAIRDATTLLEAANKWTPRIAAWFMTRHTDRQFVSRCITEARDAQILLARAIVPSRESAAA